MSKKTTEPVELSSAHASEISDILYERLQEEEREQLLKMMIQKETLKKLGEFEKRGQVIEATPEEFALQVEKRILNKLVYAEAKTKILGRR